MNILLNTMETEIANRFGTVIKQLEIVDVFNNIIMDYSIYDAI